MSISSVNRDPRWGGRIVQLVEQVELMVKRVGRPEFKS
ncbi:hypothetical protein L195_g040501, partial [Trifolium pratense]